MRFKKFIFGLAGVACLAGMAWAADCCDDPAGCLSCTGYCVPRCKASWDETKTKKPVYSMKCEYACARGRDSWHSPEADCRCTPPCGKVYVKKRLYKTDGPEKKERISKYEVEMVPVEPCGCGDCGHGGLCWWNPLNLFSLFHGH